MKQQTHFYSHLISLDPIQIALIKLNMLDHERMELIAIIESHLHYTIIDIVLSDLSPTDKKQFLEHTKQNDHEKTWIFLKEKTQNMEEKIKHKAEEIQKEMIQDILEIT